MKKKMFSIIMVIMFIFSACFTNIGVNAAGVKTYKNKIIKVNGKQYYYNASGKLVKNKFFTYKGKKYYAQKKGSLAKNKLITYKGKKYYAGKKGVIVTGKLFTFKNKKYYAQKNGNLAKNKIITYKGKKYYAGKNYSLAVSKEVTVNGKTYTADKNGVLTLKQDEKKPAAKTAKDPTTQSTTQQTTEASTVSTSCEHEWVVDVAAHYEWQSLYDENGKAKVHSICQACGCDLTQLWLDLKAKDSNIEYWQVELDHQDQNPTHGSRTATEYVHIIDENGNEVDHPHKGQSVGMDTYIPATYKCKKCGGRLILQASNSTYYEYSCKNMNLLQKYGEKIDISQLYWGATKSSGLRNGGTTTINGKTITCVEW